MTSYSTYEAKARFSELLRKVRSGQTIRITYRGQEVAEIRPVSVEETLEASLDRLEERGVLQRATGLIQLGPLVEKPGALRRFLESRA